jgi:peptide-methionine (S)-S-oxide reductase
MSLTVEAVRRYDDAAPDSDATETATVALGCFWDPDARFGAMDGVVRTRVGYASGTTPDPTYGEIGKAQREALSAHLDEEGMDPDDIETRLESLEGFTLAEPYHQKYHSKSKRWATTVFRGAGYDSADVRESPAAAKLNGHVAGHDEADSHL